MELSFSHEMLPEQRLQMVSIDDIISFGRRASPKHPSLDNYFSPTKKERFEHNYKHFLNSELLEAKHGNMDKNQYVMFVLSFQFTAPLLGIQTAKEFGKFYDTLQQTYAITEPDLSLLFSTDEQYEDRVSQEEVLAAYQDELDTSYTGVREVKSGVQKRLKKDGMNAIFDWQRDKETASLAVAFGRSIVIPSFFDYVDKRLVSFYERVTDGITYQVGIPEELS